MFTKISSWSCTDYFDQQTVINVKFSHKIIHISRTWSLMKFRSDILHALFRKSTDTQRRSSNILSKSPELQDVHKYNSGD